MASALKNYKRLFQEVKRKVDLPVYLLKGRESFIMEQFADTIAASVVDSATSSFNLDVEYGAEVDIPQLVQKANSFPFMSGKRVILLKELEMLRGAGCGKLTEYCSDPAPSCVMVIVYNSHDESGRKNRMPSGFNKLEKAAGNAGKVIEFRKMDGNDLESWIIHRLKKLDVIADRRAARSIIGNVGENLYDLRNEIDKIAVVFEGEEIDSDDISRIIGSYRFNAVYDLVDRLTGGSETESLKILLRILDSGAEKPSSIIYHLIRNMLTLMKIKCGKRAGGYWYRKRKRQAESFSKRDIKIWLENLRVADIKIKSSYIPDELIIMNCFLNSMEKKRYLDFSDTSYAGSS